MVSCTRIVENNVSLSGKTCLITGANAGIGKALAMQMANLGAHVIMFSRNEIKGKKAQQEIIDTTGNTNVDLMIADLSSLQSIKTFSEQFHQHYSKLDILVNNAGVFHQKRKESVDGYEMIFAVAHLGHFYLTLLLLNLIKKGAMPRIINVSSDIHRFFTINFDDIMFEKKYSSQRAYGSAKFANILFTKYLARKMGTNGLSINAVHPGHVRTAMTTMNESRFVRFFTSLSSPFYISTEKAAEGITFVATSSSVDGVTGEYFAKKKPAKHHKMTNNMDCQQRLWDISVKMIEARGLSVPII